MTELVRSTYGGVFYHVKTNDSGSWTLLKRQGNHVFAEYAVHRKSWRGVEWLECDSSLCPSALHRSATDCKHVVIVKAHLDAGGKENAVRWIKGG